MGANPTSPFTQTNLVPFGEYSKRGCQIGLKFPDGKININFDSNTSQAFLRQIADLLGADIVVVPGTWTFTPDPIEQDPDDA